MKIQQTNLNARSLTRCEIRSIEITLDVFLDCALHPQRSLNQSFGVWDEDEKYAGDITADGQYFTAVELERKIKQLFNPEPFRG